MISRKTLRIAGAAILGTFVGTGSAHAQVYLDADGDVQGQSQLGIEPMAATTTVEGEVYHDVTPFGDVFDVLHELDLSDVPANTDITLTYNFEGMVLLAAIPATSVGLADSARAAIGTATASPLSGGGVNDTAATFVIRNTAVTAAANATVYAKIDLGKIGIKLDADGGTGTVRMQAARSVSGDRYPGKETSVPFVTVERILEETATPPTTFPQALIDEGYEKFSGGIDDGTKVSIGTLELGVDSTPNNRWTVTGDNGQTWNTASLAGAAGAIVEAASSRVTFAGPVDFVEDVYVSASSACGQLGTPVSLVEDTDPGEGVAMAWKTGNDRALVSAFETAQHICIEVDGDTAIPAVEKYTALADYDALEGVTYPPMAMTLDLGGITRDGVNVHVPYLTTFGAYNQRIVMRNRGASAAGYSMSFATEEGVTATAGDAATGTLPANSVTVVRARDAVTISGGSRVAASINVEASSGVIQIATVQVNTSTGSTDTVLYSSQ